MFVNVRRSHIGLIRDEDIIIGNFVFEWATETDWNGAVERRGAGEAGEGGLEKKISRQRVG